MDPETKRLLREASAGPLTVEKLEELDKIHLDLLEEPARIEKHQKIIRIVSGLIASAIFAYFYDKIALWLGLPREWVGPNIFDRIWDQFL